jgi:saccharopine dehydrogenase (NAD+, L-glutamate forming)
MTSREERPFDIVLFGASGFTGQLTAEYLARHAPEGCRWAIAGRNAGKLDGVRNHLRDLDERWADLDVLIADVDDPASLRELAEAARLVITTVGPYVLYGDALVAACADAGTDYLDLTGEPEFVDTTYVRHHARAVETGARLVHCCGFDSIPHDLGAYFTVLRLPEGVPIKVEGFLRAHGTFSGGTLHSAITGFSRPKQNVQAARERKRIEPRPAGRRARSVPGKLHREPAINAWAAPLPTIDGPVVGRSARANPRYGPDFSYSHYASVKRLATVAGAAGALSATFVAAQIPPLRRRLLDRMDAGDGPSAQRRAKSWFTVTFVGSGGGRRVVTRVSGGDPGYDETAKMLAEMALCLSFDDVPDVRGQVTPATAAGDAMIARLRAAGMKFEVLE